jgi:hypothetical protein
MNVISITVITYKLQECFNINFISSVIHAEISNYFELTAYTRAYMSRGILYILKYHNINIIFLIQSVKKRVTDSNGVSMYSCCSQLEHRASVKRFVSLQFLNLRQTVGLLRRGICPTQGRYLHKQNKCRQITMPRVGFEPMILAFERTKTFHALDHAANVIGLRGYSSRSNEQKDPRHHTTRNQCLLRHGRNLNVTGHQDITAVCTERRSKGSTFAQSLVKFCEYIVWWDSALWIMFCADATCFLRISIGTAIHEIHVVHFPSRVITFHYKTTKRISNRIKTTITTFSDRLCGLVVKVPGYRSRGPGFDSRRY